MTMKTATALTILALALPFIASGQAFQDDFEKGLKAWEPLTPSSWEIQKEGENSVLVLIKAGVDRPPVRRPREYTLVKGKVWRDATITAKVKTLRPDKVKGRDICILFGYVDDTHFYYAHVCSDSNNKTHNVVMKVSGTERTVIMNENKPEPRLTAAWHTVRVSHASAGEIKVWVDDMDTPLMTAHDTDYPAGKMGLATFDDTAKFDDVTIEYTPKLNRGFTIPLIDLATETDRQVVIDREEGQYLGHPTTVLLEDNKTMVCVYPKGHGKGGIVMKRSADAGKTWSERLPVPESWSTSREVPTIHRVIDAQGTKRLIMWSGLYPARLAVSEDDGHNWSELKPVGDWGGIVVMGFVEKLKTPGRYLAMFHDSGKHFTAEGKATNPKAMKLYKTFSNDGGLTWSFPETVWQGSDVHLCEPGCIRSPDGKQLAVLLRENNRRRNSYVIFSNDEGKTWSIPRELPGALTGDRHTGKYAPDGRLFISFRDRTHESPTQGDWVGWIGTYDDLVAGREGQYRVRLMDNTHKWDCAYPGVEILPDGTYVTTTYGHWEKDKKPYVVSVRFTLDELDAKAAALK